MECLRLYVDSLDAVGSGPYIAREAGRSALDSLSGAVGVLASATRSSAAAVEHVRDVIPAMYASVGPGNQHPLHRLLGLNPYNRRSGLIDARMGTRSMLQIIVHDNPTPVERRAESHLGRFH